MRARRLTMMSFLALAALAAPPARAQQRIDVIWARQAPANTVITLDGVMDEPAWAQAEQKTIKYGTDSGIPGSGFQEEGGHLAKDSTLATMKFLVVGNQLYMGIVVRDSSVGGGPDFNRFDGLLMSIKNHSSTAFPKPTTEYFYSWWYPDTCDHDPSAPNKLPDFRGLYGNRVPQCIPRTPAMIAAWDAGTRVHGISNSDAVADTGYTIEMRFDLGAIGYNVAQANGDVVEFNISVYDCDWYWPINLARFASNRVWWQSPWGNDMWFDEVQIWSKPSITLDTPNPLPVVGPDLMVHQGSSTVTVDGKLLEPVWANADSIRIKWDDATLRASYPNMLQYRSGQFQPTVNGGTSHVFDGGDATVKWFFRADSLYLGFDVRDQCVQFVNLIDRWDGFICSINDRVARGRDRNLAGRRITFHVGPGGSGVAEDYLLALRDTLHAAQFALALKPNTTVDTLCADTDEGYTAEIRIDLTALGYPSGLGDHVLWAGFDLLDGDSFGNQSTLSYGTRTWWGRQYENECCPAYALMSTGTVGVPLADGAARLQVLSNYPNPFRALTVIRYVLDSPGDVSLEVYDLSGRRVASRALGLQSAREGTYAFTQPGLRNGLYFYRLRIADRATGAVRASTPSRMMVLD